MVNPPVCPVQSHFSHSTSSSSTLLHLKLYYTVRSAGSNSESRAGASAGTINHTLINHCHLALRQPHTSLSTTPSACSPLECWVMRGGEGHPGIRLQAMLGRKERRVMRMSVGKFTFTFRLCFHLG